MKAIQKYNTRNNTYRQRIGNRLAKLGFTGLLVAMALPSLSLCLNDSIVLEWDQKLVILSTSLFSLLLIVELSYRYPRLTTLCAGLLTLLAGVETWFIHNYSWTINSNTLSLLAETNPAEAASVLASLPKTILLYFLALLACMWLAWPRNRSIPPKPATKGRWVLYLFAWLAISLMSIYVGTYSPLLPASDEPFPTSQTGEALALRGAYPAGLPWVVLDYINERKALKNNFIRNKGFRFGTPRLPSSSHRRIYVLVIGESSRADHWGLNGYKRDTTPRLAHRENLISFRRTFTPWTYTRLSVPLLISRKPPSITSAEKFHEASILQAFREAGFHTTWVSLQAKTGFYDSPISVYSVEADDIEFLNPVDYRHRGKLDDAAIPALERVIDKNRDQDLFVVIHLLGSHFRYTDRYPASYAKFLPDRSKRHAVSLFNPADKEYLINAYDNSVRFTDSVVDDLIAQLDSQAGAETWLVYSSDHGEALFDTCTMESGHGTTSPATQSVSFLFWSSKAYRSSHPEKYTAMLSHQDTLNSTVMMFETLADLAGLEIPGNRSDNSLASVPLRMPSEVAHAEQMKSCP